MATLERDVGVGGGGNVTPRMLVGGVGNVAAVWDVISLKLRVMTEFRTIPNIVTICLSDCNVRCRKD